MRELNRATLARQLLVERASTYVQSNLPLVRVQPAGTWRVGGSPLQELVEVGEPDPERLVRAYLRAVR